jgi:phosphoadenosine phosphosulfate reductase
VSVTQGGASPSQLDLQGLNEELETAPAAEVIGWAVDRFGGELALASSFQDCVIIDLVTRVDPGLEVVFLDTGFHFPETLEYVDQVRRRYGLNLRLIRPEVSPSTWPCGTEWCCQVRKVEPLNRALQGKEAWITGLRRADTPERADAPVVGWDASRGMVKLNPLAAWSDEDMASYTAEHDLPQHPLAGRGYISIGCAPTTTPIGPGEDPRAGRWRGTGKTECGLHVDAGPPPGRRAGAW